MSRTFRAQGCTQTSSAGGVTSAEFYGHYMGGECGIGSIYGLVTTTRLGSRVVQELVRDDGETCSRAGDASANVWGDWQLRAQ